MPLSKTGWPSLNVVIFPPVMGLVLDDQKQWPPQRLLIKFTSILEDRRILAKSIAEQLGISRVWVGSIIHEDLDMQKLSAKWVLKCLNVDKKCQRCQSSEQLLEFFRHDRNDFLLWLVTMDETWLYHYDPETKQQSMEWGHSAPKNSEYKNPLEKFLPQFFGIETTCSSLIIFQRAKLSMRSITHLCWCNWRTFWRKNATERSPMGSCSCMTILRLIGRLQPRRNWPTWLPVSWSPTLFSGSGPIRLPPVPWNEKNNWKVAIFCPTWRSVLPWRPGWMDNLLNFFEWLAKVRATG